MCVLLTGAILTQAPSDRQVTSKTSRNVCEMPASARVLSELLNEKLQNQSHGTVPLRAVGGTLCIHLCYISYQSAEATVLLFFSMATGTPLIYSLYLVCLIKPPCERVCNLSKGSSVKSYRYWLATFLNVLVKPTLELYINLSQW